MPIWRTDSAERRIRILEGKAPACARDRSKHDYMKTTNGLRWEWRLKGSGGFLKTSALERDWVEEPLEAMPEAIKATEPSS